MSNPLSIIPPQQYVTLFSEAVSLAKAVQQEKNIAVKVEKETQARLQEITQKLSAFEKILQNDQERFMNFQQNTFIIINEMIKKMK